MKRHWILIICLVVALAALVTAQFKTSASSTTKFLEVLTVDCPVKIVGTSGSHFCRIYFISENELENRNPLDFEWITEIGEDYIEYKTKTKDGGIRFRRLSTFFIKEISGYKEPQLLSDH